MGAQPRQNPPYYGGRIVARLVRFLDHPRRGCWSRVDLPSGEHVLISVGLTGVLVQQSRLGLFGKTLFDEHSDASLRALISLREEFAESTAEKADLPSEMVSPALAAFTQAALASASADELAERLKRAAEPRES